MGEPGPGIPKASCHGWGRLLQFPGEGDGQGSQQQFAFWAVDISLLLEPLQEPWLLTTGAGGAFRGLEMT